MARHGYRNPETISLVRAAYNRGLTRNAIAREIGISPSTVSLITNELGLNFDRTVSAVAVESRQVDNRVRRQNIADRLLAAAERELDRLEANTYTHRVPSGQGATALVTDDVANSDEVRNHMQAIYSATVAASKLIAVDVDPTAAAAKSKLNALSEALGLHSGTSS